MIDWTKEAKDQGAHLLAGFALVQLIQASGSDLSPWAGAIATLGVGIMREFTERQCAKAERKRWDQFQAQMMAEFAHYWTLEADGIAYHADDAIPRSRMLSWGSIRDYCGWFAAGLIGGAI